MAFKLHELHESVDKVTGKEVVNYKRIPINALKNLTNQLLSSNTNQKDRGLIIKFGDMIEKMLNLDSGKRITIEDVRAHDFVKTANIVVDDKAVETKGGKKY